MGQSMSSLETTGAPVIQMRHKPADVSLSSSSAANWTDWKDFSNCSDSGRPIRTESSFDALIGCRMSMWSFGKMLFKLNQKRTMSSLNMFDQNVCKEKMTFFQSSCCLLSVRHIHGECIY